MKHALFLILVIGLFSSTSCKKRMPQENCYAVFYLDSVYSTNSSLIKRDTVTSGPFKNCGWTGAMAETFNTTHTYSDTIERDSVLVVIVHKGATQIW